MIMVTLHTDESIRFLNIHLDKETSTLTPSEYSNQETDGHGRSLSKLH